MLARSRKHGTIFYSGQNASSGVDVEVFPLRQLV